MSEPAEQAHPAENQGVSEERIREIARQEARTRNDYQVGAPRLQTDKLQFIANAFHQLSGQLARIEGAINLRTETLDLEVTQDALAVGKQVLKEGQKELQIFDRGGVRALQLYRGASDIGDDAADNARIQRCLDAANQEQNRKAVRFARPYYGLRQPYHPYQYPAQLGFAANYRPQATGSRGIQPGMYAPRQASANPKMRYPCRICHQLGHWYAECPENPESSKDQLADEK